MKNAKQFIVILTALSLSLSAAGCTAAGEPTENAAAAETASAPSPSPVPTATPVPAEKTLSLYGVEFSSHVSELDLTGCTLEDGGEALLKLLPDLPYIERILLTDNGGLTYDELDALSEQCSDYAKLIWTIHIGNYWLPSDTTTFMPTREGLGGLNSQEYPKLKYFHDLIGLDLGHQAPADISFLYGTPHLQYLILADSPVSDLTPVGSLKELIYLELFKTTVTDLSPLLGCESLLDLNLCYIPCTNGDAHWAVLSQMTQLERLFYFGNPWTIQERNDLIACFPESAEIVLYDRLESTGLDWRYHPRYYAMRDLFDMYYMEGGTNGVPAANNNTNTTEASQESAPAEQPADPDDTDTPESPEQPDLPEDPEEPSGETDPPDETGGEI